MSDSAAGVEGLAVDVGVARLDRVEYIEARARVRTMLRLLDAALDGPPSVAAAAAEGARRALTSFAAIAAWL